MGKKKRRFAKGKTHQKKITKRQKKDKINVKTIGDGRSDNWMQKTTKTNKNKKRNNSKFTTTKNKL